MSQQLARTFGDMSRAVWNPFEDVDFPLHRHMRTRMHGREHMLGSYNYGRADVLAGKAEGSKEVRIELPGTKKEDIDVENDNGMLRITAHRKDELKGDNEHSYYEASFERVWSVPEGVDASKIACKYADGVLTVSVPAPEVAAPKPTKLSIA